MLRTNSARLISLPVMVLTTSVTATSRVLPVFADPAVTVGHVSSQLPGLLLTGGHSYTWNINTHLIILFSTFNHFLQHAGGGRISGQ